MGLLHIYCGDGKGKTTASLGLALRMAGAGMRVAFVQFMKGGETAELASLARLPEITVMRCERDYGFYGTLTEDEKRELANCHNDLLARAFSGNFDAVILDEFNIAYKYRLLDCENAVRMIADNRERCEIVLTGRDPDEKLLDMADYISEIKCVRHPYKKGIQARKGIEF